ncbi:MAG TPA: CDP-diacylglycerol--serine O-phosphatidyltransferase [Flavisolibacter sp.]|jgi:CDP-diacylglycerol---serine O-phosphatidyltransferase|nr:CDP-diacylglycerol--serine O-phosphatidyltransferase [Flavisolibacter sp.]
MPLFKNIPNLFTLLNLIFGCIAIVYILQVGQSIVILNDQTGAYDPFFPEKLAWGSLFIFLAAVVDFLDGFVARMFKATSKMGEQLDSLSDLVSFGVAPGMILYQLLRLGYAQQENGLDVSFVALLPAFIFTAAGAWRLAKFNISTDQSNSFKGVPIPAAGLLIASFPLIIWYGYFGIQGLFINKWFLYGMIVLTSYLMVSNLPLMALKFKDFSFGNNKARFILLALSLIIVIVLAVTKMIWLAWPIIFLLYVLLSLFYKEPVTIKSSDEKTLNVTV